MMRKLIKWNKMPAPDLNQSFDTAKSRINSIKTFVDTSKSVKEAKKSAGNSESKSTAAIASPLDKVADQQKRYQRNPPTSFDQLIDLIGLTSGSGSFTSRYLRKKLLEATLKAEPQVKKIIQEEALKVLGCAQEQTYKGYSLDNLKINPLETLPASDGIYLPLNWLDFGGILKIPNNSVVGKIIYEHEPVSVADGVYRPYKGPATFPMLKEMNLRLNTQTTYKQDYGKYYQGVSNQPSFDFQFKRENKYGVNQDCYRIALINRVDVYGSGSTSSTTVSNTFNRIEEFLQDYYKTVKLYDAPLFAGVLLNLLSNSINIELKAGYDEISLSTQFELILQRILGLCFDSRREIDVSGVAKVAELDGVDNTFFEPTDIDLRTIENRANNIQNKVIEFVDCDNLKLPVNYQTINEELVKFRESLSGLSLDNQVKGIEGILDTLTSNPDWKVLIPNNVEVKASFDKDVLKKIPLALASASLNPKVLLPIFMLLGQVEQDAYGLFGNYVTSANTYIQSGNTQLGKVNNIINNSVDFLKVFQEFNIQVVSKIGAIYLKVLYEILKKDIINLLTSVIQDISKSASAKKATTILRLVNLLLVVAQLVDDYRRCKSLVEDIIRLLNLIFQLSGAKGIPLPLLLLADLLPGTSPERSTINTIEFLQSVGIPTGTLPDGSPNVMNIFNFMMHKGADKEQAENGKISGVGKVLPVVGGLVKISGVPR